MFSCVANITWSEPFRTYLYRYFMHLTETHISTLIWHRYFMVSIRLYGTTHLLSIKRCVLFCSVWRCSTPPSSLWRRR